MPPRNVTQTIAVIGQGYVGLPLAMRAVDVGYTVVGVDLDHHRVEALRQGRSFVEDVPDATVAHALSSGHYRPTTDYSEVLGFDVAVISVPTPLKDTLPDLSFIEEAARSLAPYVQACSCVVLESTTYPGTTEELLVPLLEAGSGLVAGLDFFVGYSPERIDPGNSHWNFVNTPKVVSGINPRSRELVDAFYSSMIDTTVPVSSTREAELTKLLENTFRHVNIALVNELAVFANDLGVNIWDAIDAAATKPFGYMRFTPGPGVGGHCLPVDPSYLSWQVRRSLGKSFRFVELANDVNEHMPDYVVQRAIELLNDQGRSLKGARILLAGVAYKKNSGDNRESPALRVIELLNRYGATVVAADPYVPEPRWPLGTPRVEFITEILSQTDLVIIITDHDAFDYSLLKGDDAPLVLDTRNRANGIHVHKL